MKHRDVENFIKTSTAGFAPELWQNIRAQSAGVVPESGRIPNQNRFMLRKFAVAFAAVIVLLVCGIFSYLYLDGEAKTVYFDVNPSVALTLNRLGRVKDVEFYNDDAASLFGTYAAKGKSAEEVLDYFISQAADSGYFDNENAQLYLSAYAGNGADTERILNKLSSAAEKTISARGIAAEVNKQTCNADETVRAKQLSISPGKLKLIENIILENDRYTVEDLRDKSMGELKKLLRDNDSENNNNGENNGNNSQNKDNNGQANGNRNGKEKNQGNGNNK